MIKSLTVRKLNIFFLKNFFGLFDSKAEDMTGNRGRVTRSKGTRASCRTSAHGTPAPPTELSGAPRKLNIIYNN